ncbi:MAG: hypothetical protein J6T40_08785 [Clostridiales bacterium]|nr:hypothetical protein [Clostridiales bacterium]
MNKRLLSVILSAMMLFTCSGIVCASEDPSDAQISDPIEISLDTSEEEDFSSFDNDAAFDAYVDEAFENGELPTEIEIDDIDNAGATRYAKRLTGLDLTLYKLLGKKIVSVANGSLTSTVFSFSLSDMGLKSEYTAAELGVSGKLYDFDNYQYTDACINAVQKKFGISPSKIIYGLLEDCPYEMYWFDKTYGFDIDSLQIQVEQRSGKQYLKLLGSYSFKLPVAKEYSYAGRTGTYVMGATPAKVKTAITNANNIIKKYENSVDYYKMLGYKNEIGLLNTYNMAAVDENWDYGNAWQLIWVFDGDKSTNVVCEGYAKAFRYLCDRTKFNDPNVYCTCVTGEVTHDGEGGAHMWNVVHMGNGKNYLVDPTWCDSEISTTPSNDYFMRGYTSYLKVKERDPQTRTSFETMQYSFKTPYGTTTYTYDYYTIYMYPLASGALYLANSNYQLSSPTSTPKNLAISGLRATSAGKNKVKLTWAATEGADGYLVYGQKNGKYAYVGMTTTGTSFTDTKAISSDYNYYWVFPYYLDANDNMRPGKCAKYVFAKGVCPAVTNLKASSVKGGVKLTWTASAGAEGYLVYGIVNGQPYKYLGMTTKGTTFTDSKASATDFNYYWVYPYFKDASGNMVVGLTGKYTYGRALK